MNNSYGKSLSEDGSRTPEEVVEYALKVLEDTERPSQPQRASLEEFRAFLDALAEGSESIPPVPSSAFSRENIYRSDP